MKISEMGLLEPVPVVSGEVLPDEEMEEPTFESLQEDLEERDQELYEALDLLETTLTLLRVLGDERLTPTLLKSHRKQLRDLGKDVMEFVSQWEM